jgi:hypothetical protein
MARFQSLMVEIHFICCFCPTELQITRLIVKCRSVRLIELSQSLNPPQKEIQNVYLSNSPSWVVSGAYLLIPWRMASTECLLVTPRRSNLSQRYIWERVNEQVPYTLPQFDRPLSLRVPPDPGRRLPEFLWCHLHQLEVHIHACGLQPNLWIGMLQSCMNRS